MEPRAAAASHDAESDITTVWTTTQSAHGAQEALADVLGVDKPQLGVIAQTLFPTKPPAEPPTTAVNMRAVWKSPGISRV